MTRPLLRRGLALRIYLVSVTAVLAVGVALFLTARLAADPLRHPVPVRELGVYAAHHLGQAWGRQDALRRELGLATRSARVLGTVYAWDGTRLATTSEAPPAPLDAETLAALARDGMGESRARCDVGPCYVQYLIGPPEAPLGYLVLEPRDRSGPPPDGRALVPIAVLLIGLGIAAAVLGRSLARPLDRLAEAARALGSGDLGARTGLDRRDELGALARAFDGMAERVQGLLRSQTELIANVAHELRTPLARIRVALDLAADGDAEMARESLAEIGEDLAELERLVDDVLASARMDLADNTARAGGAPAVRAAALDLTGVIRGAAERLRHRHPEREVTVEVEGPVPKVQGDAVLLRRILDNLLDNARKYSAPGRPIRLRAGARGGDAIIQVIDQGDGLPREDLERLFTPFFRSDRSRSRATGGIGLGLTLARRIAEAHGGTLGADSTPGQGTTFTLTLPAQP